MMQMRTNRARSSEVRLERVHLTKLRRSDRTVRVESFAEPPRKGSSFAAFERRLPDILAGRAFRDLAEAIARAARKRRTLLWMLGAHVFKTGLSKVLIELARKGAITAIATNGAGAIHDFELASIGATSEDVGRGLAHGRFGMARETGEFFAHALSASPHLGFGEAVCRELLERRPRFSRFSLLHACARIGIPVTVHVALGSDIVHQQPSSNGEDIGRASLQDFRRLCSVVARLENGVVLNVGSAVILPEVFLKAFTVARNLGHRLKRFTAANLDMIQHYRPRTNVLDRPTAFGGKSLTITGHHELTVPLLAQAVMNRL